MDLKSFKGGEKMKKYCMNCIYHTLKGNDILYKEGDKIFLDGDKLTSVYLISEGFVKVCKTFQNGEERIFDILSTNDFIGLVVALREDKNYIASAYALNDVKVKQILVEDVLTVFHSNESFKDMCFKCTVTRTNLFQSHLFNTTSAHLEDKIMIILEHLTKKFGTYSNGEYILDLPISKTTLASIIGVRRETLSRKLSKMQDLGIIKMDKNKYTFDRM